MFNVLDLHDLRALSGGGDISNVVYEIGMTQIVSLWKMHYLLNTSREQQ